jgi:putative FmdB family regulatory protein
VPLYDFRCENCETTFEELAAPGAGAGAVCPACGSATTTRLWTPVSPALKLEVRGRAARESNARRADREARRQAGEL